MASLRQGVAYTRTFLLVQSVDHLTGLTGASPTVTISKAGGSFASAGGSVTELANGWYKIALTTTDTNTLGDLAYHVTATSADPTDFVDQVVADVGTLPLVRVGTAQAGNTGSITLDASASSTNSFYLGELIYLTGGTGAGQARTIASYNGSTKQVVVDHLWFTAPDSTTTFAIVPANGPLLNSALQVSTSNSTTVVQSGTAQTGSTSTTIKLSSAASSTDNVYVGDLINITGGTGQGQSRTILAYNGTTKVATVDRAWAVTPTNTSNYSVLASTTPSSFSDQGVAQAGGSTTITLAATASSSDDTYNGSLVSILAGTGAGQTREITDYTGSTRVATVDTAWSTNPDSTSVYAVIPLQSTTTTGPSSFVILADGVAHGGAPGSSTATLALEAVAVSNQNEGGTAVNINGKNYGLHVVGQDGDAVQLTSSSGSAISFTANGSGATAIALNSNGVALSVLCGSGYDAVQVTGGGGGGKALAAAGGVALTNDAGDALTLASAGGGHDLNLAGDGLLNGSLGGYILGALADLAAVPGATATTTDAINWLYQLARNKRTQTGSTETVYKDNGTTAMATSAKTDDGTVFTRGKYT
jgi:hypothetical protein